MKRKAMIISVLIILVLTIGITMYATTYLTEKRLEKQTNLGNKYLKKEKQKNQVNNKKDIEIQKENKNSNEKENEYIIVDSDKRKLLKEDVRLFDESTLRLARNEIFARHGYIFKTEEISNYFKSKSWYKENQNYEGILTDIEKYNVDYIKEFEEMLSDKKDNKIDLNGDKKYENISFNIDGWNAILKVNNSMVKCDNDNLEGKYHVVDINKSDKYKEVLITDYGPSADYTTAFYYYTGEKIIFMGKISGLYSDEFKNITIKGDGTLETYTRGDILHTWFYKDYYKLDDDHKLINIPQDLYEMHCKVTVKKNIPLLKSRGSTEIIDYLQIGENAIILSSDNKSWCLIEKENGIKGWIEIENYSDIKRTKYRAGEVFEGLCYAD